MKKIKNSQPQTKFTGSYRKKRVEEIFYIISKRTSVSVFIRLYD